MKRLLGTGILVVLALAMVSITANGSIVAHFTDGNTDEEIDGYPGMAGGGWADGWGTPTETIRFGDGPTLNVTDTNPVNSGGNYLDVNVASGTRELTLSRGMDRPNSVVDLTKEHTVSFDFRIDNIEAMTTSTSGSWIRLVNADSDSPNDTKHTWYIGAFGNTSGPAAWFARSGTTTGVTSVTTGIVPEQGETYSFTIHVFPEDSQFRLVLTDSLGNSFDSDDPDDYGARLNFRGTDPLTRAGDRLLFDMQKPNNDTDSGKLFTYSLDNLQVIPEPHSLVLLLAGAGAIGLSARRRLRR